ncbi:thiaminase (transcriptional activator TenA) [Asanoa hainanensis]|uniref:Aminopyrimidine aminohydrolase n=1 Tax=Asanoa hainanensis TaxID=560556 RepID=A0A239PA78_9ACTN|nr:TenA family transcriptional regulator [Asanoa hainanensis]SNT63967.1 thiaminase (transcriptional activator TenA) [Asanoa hainanensis]
MQLDDLLRRHAAAWADATEHPFLTGVRDGTLAPAAFAEWLVQDHHFVADLLAFQARLLARAPRHAQAVLAAGLVALVDELSWFEDRAGQHGLDLTAAPGPATLAYRELLDRLDAAPVPQALVGLWAIERAYLDAWTFAAPGAPAFREYVEHWTAPGFADYVAGLAAAASRDLGPADEVLTAVAAAETAFWGMA